MVKRRYSLALGAMLSPAAALAARLVLLALAVARPSVCTGAAAAENTTFTTWSVPLVECVEKNDVPACAGARTGRAGLLLPTIGGAAADRANRGALKLREAALAISGSAECAGTARSRGCAFLIDSI